MTDALPIAREETAGRGRYVIHMPDGSDAEMTFARQDPTTIVIDHTGVPPQFRGQKIAEPLMVHAIAEARARGEKIVPVCSYVVAQFRRHPEWEDLRA